MRVPRRNVIGLILVLISLIGYGNEIKFAEITNKEEWQAAFDRAKAEDKLVFVDIYTDWCTYCHKLDKEVYTNPDVVSYFNDNFINIKFDAETEFGYPLTDKYDVTGFPRLLFLTSEQNIFESIEGFVPANVLLQYGSGATDNWKSLPDLLDAYKNKSLDREGQLRLIGILERTNPEQAEFVAEGYISDLKEEDYQDIENLWLVSRFQNQLTGKSYQYISANREKIIEMHGLTEFGDYMKSVYNDNLNLAIRYGKKDLLERLVLEVLPEFLESNEIAEAAYITKKLYYRERQEFESYRFEVEAYKNNHLKREDQPAYLFENAMEIIETTEDKTMYEFAATLLKESLEIRAESFEATALLGYVNGLLGNFKSAEDLLSKAKGLSSNSDEKGMVDNLIEAIDIMKGN